VWTLERSFGPLEVSTPQTFEEAKAQLSSLAQEAGFDHFGYVGGRAFNPKSGGHAIWTQPPVIINTYPIDFLTTYHKQDFGRIDPVLTETMRRRLPFAWDAEGISELRPQEKSFFSIAHDFKIARGLTVPVYGPLGDFALFSFVAVTDQKTFKKLIGQYLHRLHVACIYSHQLLSSLGDGSRPEIILTPREIEILHWTALGKTMADIGEILSLSPKTVQFHMYNSMKKLGVYSKAAATAKAVILGLIRP
jgi:DNA-binding CsgD family transcriptional regulator